MTKYLVTFDSIQFRNASAPTLAGPDGFTTFEVEAADMIDAQEMVIDQMEAAGTIHGNITSIARAPQTVVIKPNTFVAIHVDAMRNGSVYRITGRKREYAAQYINGDFMGFVSELPPGMTIYKRWKAAKAILPRCFSGY